MSYLDWLIPSRLINQMEKRLMASLTDIGNNVVAIAASVDALAGDIQVLNDKITELQTGGGIPPALQAQIDDIAAQSSIVATRIADLDAITPAP